MHIHSLQYLIPAFQQFVQHFFMVWFCNIFKRVKNCYRKETTKHKMIHSSMPASRAVRRYSSRAFPDNPIILHFPHPTYHHIIISNVVHF